MSETFRYRVVDVQGCMVGRLRVGSVVYEDWVGAKHRHVVHRLPDLAVSGSYTIESEGPATAVELGWLSSRRSA